MRLFFPLKQIDRPLLGGAVDSAIGHLVSPRERMEVESRQREEGSSRKEIFLNVLHISFYATFFMRRFHIAGGRLKKIVGGEIEEAWIEMDAAVESV